MSVVKISAAFEKKLATIASNLATAYENVSYSPVEGIPYQRVRLLPAAPENPTLGDGYYREVGFFEIILFYPINKGRGAAQLKAEAIKAHFARGLAMTESGLTVKVMRTPIVGSAVQDDKNYILPISINYFAEVIP
jgi:hypothetical protein